MINVGGTPNQPGDWVTIHPIPTNVPHVPLPIEWVDAQHNVSLSGVEIRYILDLLARFHRDMTERNDHESDMDNNPFYALGCAAHCELADRLEDLITPLPGQGR